jgi:hypothetical protein
MKTKNKIILGAAIPITIIGGIFVAKKKINQGKKFQGDR